MNELRLAASEQGGRLMRNEVGGGWVGQYAGRYKGDVVISNARFIEFGLGKGSSDLIGWTKDGRFWAVEAKVGSDRPSKEQLRFVERVRAHGGQAAVCWSVEQMLDDLLKR